MGFCRHYSQRKVMVHFAILYAIQDLSCISMNVEFEGFESVFQLISCYLIDLYWMNGLGK